MCIHESSGAADPVVSISKTFQARSVVESVSPSRQKVDERQNAALPDWPPLRNERWIVTVGYGKFFDPVAVNIDRR
jgi:hypothetical protein